MRNVLGGTRKLKAESDIFNTIFQVLLRVRFSRSAQGGRTAWFHGKVHGGLPIRLDRMQPKCIICKCMQVERRARGEPDPRAVSALFCL